MLQVRHCPLKTREVVEFTVHKRLAKVAHVVHQKLLGSVNVVGELPDDVNIHHMFQTDAAHGAGSRLGEVNFLSKGRVVLLALARDGNGVERQ